MTVSMTSDLASIIAVVFIGTFDNDGRLIVILLLDSDQNTIIATLGNSRYACLL